MTGRALFLLRDGLAFAEREYALAEFIDQTSRQQEQRAYWAGQIERLRAAIAFEEDHGGRADEATLDLSSSAPAEGQARRADEARRKLPSAGTQSAGQKPHADEATRGVTAGSAAEDHSNCADEASPNLSSAAPSTNQGATNV